MTLHLEDWHLRYLEQARWTRSLREYLFEKSGLNGSKRILDVGCGTGALELDFRTNIDFLPFGLDIDHATLNLARKNLSAFSFIQGNAQRMPFDSRSFEISFCHFLLLWVESPEEAVREMARVTKPGGAVIAIAEPDYGGRIDYPEQLSQIGHWQVLALQKQGADPRSGRKLIELFTQSGLIEIETGVIGGRWTTDSPIINFESEWKIIEADLESLNLPSSEKASILQIKKQDSAAWLEGRRVLYVPIFYAWGRVPGFSY